MDSTFATQVVATSAATTAYTSGCIRPAARLTFMPALATFVAVASFLVARNIATATSPFVAVMAAQEAQLPFEHRSVGLNMAAYLFLINLIQ